MVITNGGTTTLNFTLSNSVATLTGYVYDVNSQARIAGATLLVDSDVHDGWSNTANPTGSNGVYSLDRIAAGRTYYLHAFPPSPYNSTYITIAINPGANTSNIGVSASSGGFHVHVGIAGGGNAANATIYIGPSASGGGSSTCSGTTDNSGNFSCSVAPGNYDVHAYDYPGYSGLAYYTQPVGNSFTTVNITLNNGRLTISGQARDYQLNPINNTNVQAFEYANPGHFRTTFVGSDGSYNFPGLGTNGPYELSASAVGYSPLNYTGLQAPSNNWVYNFKLGHFPDVVATDANNKIEFPFYYVESLRAAGVTHGFPDGTFGPLTNVKRGEYAQLLVTAMGWAIDTAGGPHFSDVPTSYAFYGAIETAKNRGAISGYPDGTYRPNSNVSRAEATKLSAAVSGWTLQNPPTADYTDVPTNQWAYQFIETALAHGANANDGGGYFRPNAAATRAETAKLLCVANTTCQ